jgi:hypothetical protein
MNGDGKKELMVVAQLQGGNVTCFSPGSSQYWKMYTTSGNGFSLAGTNFPLPDGGKLSGSVTYGFNNAGSMALTSDNTGSQSWTLADMNGDGGLDLVITAQLQGGKVTSFSPTSAQYWKVFLSTFTTTGLGEQKNGFSFLTAYPNPSNGNFTIEGSTEEKLTICNELGQTVKMVSLNSSNNFTAEINGLEAGVYFVSGTQHAVSKFIVLK